MPETWLYDENPAMFRSSPLLFTLLLISVVGILGLGVWWIKCKGERLAVSDREVLMERGLLAKQRTQLNLSTVRTVRISQTVGQRIFGVGNIEIFSAGDYAEIAIRGMRNPDRVRELVSVHNDAQPVSVR
ncbi:MAG: PH domain-containing protein [Sphingobium phenoxybenzoativorans]|uniref:PH domain-containing protein n=1 Tax=Sphingobium phenoxybenzoativorans TaxID=1592790 RepID=A0A975K6V1_9SPHN|nr:PH domain-containing protein [Sphingobium phenoxybenzoativorans]QUT05864.1 PH domain-containing protein [Sphingobium phenoxybenzoativorans]